MAGSLNSTLQSFSLRVRLTLVFVFFALAAVIIPASISYLRLPSEVESSEGKRLEAVAKSAAAVVNYSRHSKIVQGYLSRDPSISQSPEFKELQEAFQGIRKANSLAGDITTFIRPQWKQDTMVFIAMSNERAYIGNGLPLPHQVQKTLETATVTHSDLLIDHDGTWLSVYVPLLTPKGTVFAGLQVDSRVDTALSAALERWQLEAGVGGLAALVICSVFGFLVSGWLAAPLIQLHAMTAAVVREGINSRLRIDLRNESGRLASVLNQLFSTTAKKLSILSETCRAAEVKLVERTEELNDKTLLITTLLHKLPIGLVVFGPDGKVLSASTSARRFFQNPTEGSMLWEVLGLEEREITPGLRACFEEGASFTNEIRALPPFLDDGHRRVKLDYVPLVESGRTKAIALFGMERASEEQVQETALRDGARLRSIVQLLLHREAYVECVAYVGRALNALKAEIADPTAIDFNLATFCEILAGVSERSSFFFLNSIASVSQAMESEAREFAAAPPRMARAIVPKLHEWLNSLDRAYDELLDEHGAFLRAELDSETRQRVVIEHDLTVFGRKLADSGSSELAEAFSRQFIKQKISTYFAHMTTVLQWWAAQKGKQVKSLRIQGGDARIAGHDYGELFLCVEQAFKNAVQHGIESADERKSNGKEGKGQVQLTCVIAPGASEGEEWLTLAVADDGGGIDPRRIRSELRFRGRAAEAEKESDHEVLQHLFEGGFGETDPTTDRPGHGLKDLATLVRSMGGLIEVQSALGRGTTLTVLVPLKKSENRIERAA